MRKVKVKNKVYIRALCVTEYSYAEEISISKCVSVGGGVGQKGIKANSMKQISPPPFLISGPVQ